METEDLLRQRGPAILNRWRGMIKEAYPVETAAFLHGQTDRFRNPVGHTLLQQTSEIYDAFLRDERPANVAGLMDPLIRIRAVQDLTPAQAVDFVFRLKDAIREELANEMSLEGVAARLLSFESRIDAFALVAFDCYMACREQIYTLRTDEIGRQTRVSLERAGRLGEAEKRTTNRCGIEDAT
jgi:RsbRD-like negative regulator of sigma factor